MNDIFSPRPTINHKPRNQEPGKSDLYAPGPFFVPEPGARYCGADSLVDWGLYIVCIGMNYDPDAYQYRGISQSPNQIPQWFPQSVSSSEPIW
jgi:hypothetical protein